MKMSKAQCLVGFAVVAWATVVASKAWADVFNMGPGLTSLETVTVGNSGNAADTRFSAIGFGRVDYTYAIGRYEVTAGQYTAFLNAVASTDTYGLYNTSMWSSNYGCKIQRAGSPGSYTYSVDTDWANRPVNYVSWGDSARFANWLQNGQPTGPQGPGTTENGAYSLTGATSVFALMAVTREAGWKWAITSEDEWYKAAYHKNDGITGSYFDYPTGGDAVPSNMRIDPDPGNNANFYQNGYTVGSPYYRTEVGDFENSDSPYGTFDQGGNVWEWNESVVNRDYRGVRGGSFVYYGDVSLRASNRDYDFPTDELPNLGFRVSAVPEPGTFALVSLSLLVLLRTR